MPTPGDIQDENSGAPSDALIGAQEIDRRLRQLEEQTEIELIRREARLVPVLLGVVRNVRIEKLTDERSLAALSALFWRIFSPGTATAAAGLLILFLTAVQANLIWQQNRKIDQQTYLMQSQVNVALTTQLGPLLEDLTQHLKQLPCLAPETMAMQSSSDLKQCWLDLSEADQRARWLRCRHYEKEAAEKASPSALQAPKNECKSTSVDYTDNRLPIPEDLAARVMALTRLARSYRFLASPTDDVSVVEARPVQHTFQALADRMFTRQDGPELFPTPLSPERGILLSHLLSLGYDISKGVAITQADFSDAYTPELRADGAELPILKNGYFPYASFRGSLIGVLSKGNFKCASFDEANLFHGDVQGSDLSGASLARALLPEAKYFRPRSMVETNLNFAIVPEEDYLERLRAQNIPGFDFERWKIRRSNDKFRIVGKNDPDREWDSSSGSQGRRLEYCYGDRPRSGLRL